VVVIGAVQSRTRPAPAVAAGIVLGLAGVALLLGGGTGAAPAPAGPATVVGALAVLCAAFSFATGALFSRQAPQPSSQTLATALNMLAGGGLLLLLGTLNGELGQLQLPAVSLKSWLAVAYLVVFGSLIGYSAYMWLVKATTAAQASSNFYVNPVVAVLLGWFVGDEVLTGRILLVAALIVGAVVLIVSHPGRQRAPEPASREQRTVSSGP
jgi:drug/metabolite transporter (DMT)-like permease